MGKAPENDQECFSPESLIAVLRQRRSRLEIVPLDGSWL